MWNNTAARIQHYDLSQYTNTIVPRLMTVIESTVLFAHLTMDIDLYGHVQLVEYIMPLANARQCVNNVYRT